MDHPLETKIDIPTGQEDAVRQPEPCPEPKAVSTPPDTPDISRSPDSEPLTPRRRRTSSKKRRPRKAEVDGEKPPKLTLPQTTGTSSPDGSASLARDSAPTSPHSPYPVTPNIDELSVLQKSVPKLLAEFRTTLTLVQVLGGGGLDTAGEESPSCTLVSVRACVTRTWLLLVRLLYVAYAAMCLVSMYYFSISPLENVTIFWPSTALNLMAAISTHLILNRDTDKLYVLLGTLSARQPKNIKTCIVIVLASMTAVTAMLTLRFYEASHSRRNLPLTGSRSWTVYTFTALYFCRNFESLIVVGSTVFAMVLYALIAAAIKFELRAIIEEPVPHESSIVRHSTISKLIAYSDDLFSPLCCFWVAAVIGNVCEGLAMARYHQTVYALPHITTWAHALMLAAGYFAVCECSYGLSVEAERVRLWVHRRYQGQSDSYVLRYLHQQRNFPKTLTLWESIDLSRQAVVITLALPVMLYTIILLILDPISHGTASQAMIDD